MTLTWLIEFDWDNNGAYETNEASYVTSLAIERGRPDAFADCQSGKCVLTLDNNTRRFDPWYSSSALYPNVAPKRPMRVRCTYSGTTYSLFAGKIEEIEPMGVIGQRTVTITAYDTLRELSQMDVDSSLQTNIQIDYAIGQVLDDAGLTGDRDFDASAIIIGYWWTKEGGSPRERIDELARCEHGAIFIMADGTFRFLNREAYTTGTVVATINENDLTDIALAQPWQSIYNGVDVRTHPVTAADTAAIWTLNDREVYIAPGETVTMWAPFTNADGRECSASNVVTPLVATTDYTANTATDGSGQDMTSYLSVSTTVYSTRAKLTCTNSGSTYLYITFLQVRGKALSEEIVQVRAEDSSSQTTYGKRWLTLDVPWQQSVERGKDLANALCDFYSTPRPPATVRMEHVLPDLLDFELHDRVALVSSTYSIASTMQLIRLRLETGRTMQELIGELYLEPAEVQTSWELGLTGSGELGTVTWLGY